MVSGEWSDLSSGHATPLLHACRVTALFLPCPLPPTSHCLSAHLPSYSFCMRGSSSEPSHGPPPSLLNRLLLAIKLVPSASLKLLAAREMSPAIGPEIAPASALGPYGRSTVPMSRSSTSSQSEADNVTLGTSPAYSASSFSIPFEDCDVDVVRVEGLRHSDRKLEAR